MVFVLATTEVHKVPMTILSRCQRFDFRRFAIREIAERLRYVTMQENIEADEGALLVIAHHGDGSMRDALGILDQCIAYADGPLTEEVAVEALGTVTREKVAEFAALVAAGRIGEALAEIKALEEEGKDLAQFLKELMGHFRDVLMIAAGGSKELVDASPEILPLIDSQGKEVELRRLLKLLDICGEALQELRWASRSRIILEMAVIKGAIAEDQGDIGERLAYLEERIARLEKGPVRERERPREEEAMPPREERAAERRFYIRMGRGQSRPSWSSGNSSWKVFERPNERTCRPSYGRDDLFPLPMASCRSSSPKTGAFTRQAWSKRATRKLSRRSYPAP